MAKKLEKVNDQAQILGGQNGQSQCACTMGVAFWKESNEVKVMGEDSIF